MKNGNNLRLYPTNGNLHRQSNSDFTKDYRRSIIDFLTAIRGIAFP
jgi:hypothetical protein